MGAGNSAKEVNAGTIVILSVAEESEGSILGVCKAKADDFGILQVLVYVKSGDCFVKGAEVYASVEIGRCLYATSSGSRSIPSKITPDVDLWQIIEEEADRESPAVENVRVGDTGAEGAGV